MDSKNLKKSIFIIVTAMIVVVWNIGCYNAIFTKGINPFNQINPTDDNPSINIDNIIDPPLGNETTLPKATTLLTLFAFNLPMEIIIIFLAETVMGSILRIERQRMTFLRLLLLLGSSLALTVFDSVIHYFVVWPVMHDWPINRGLTFNDTITDPSGIITPQYGGAQVFFSKGVGVLLFMVAMIVIVGLHFPVFKFILRYRNLQSILSLVIPFLNYLIVWLLLAKQITENTFNERTGKTFYLSLIFAGGFILVTLLLLLWNASMVSRLKKETENTQIEKQHI